MSTHEAWGPFALLAAVIAVRSFVYFGMVTFIPLYYENVLHTSKALGSVALSAMLFGGAVGTLTGGPLADRFGRRNVLIGSMLVIPPLVVGFLLSGPIVAIGFAALAGAATIATFAVTIVMGQEYLPGRLGVSAGVTIGLSIGLGGVGAPLLGLLAEAQGSDRGVRGGRGSAVARAGADACAPAPHAARDDRRGPAARPRAGQDCSRDSDVTNSVRRGNSQREACLRRAIGR